MTANLKAGNFNSLNVTSSDLNNIKFDWQGNFSTTNKSFNMISKGAIKFDSDGSSRFRTSTGDMVISTDNGKITIESEGTTNDAIYINSSNTSGGIHLNSGTIGTKSTSTGDISLISNGADINIGLPDDDFDIINVDNLTRNIQLEATSAISMNSDDFQVLASDSIAIISLSNDIVIGDSITSPAIRISGGDISFGTASNSSDGKFVIGVSQSSSRKTGYDGIVLSSSSDDVTPEFLIKNNNGTGRLVSGVESTTSTTSIQESYLAYKSNNNIIRINGPEFSIIDVGKTFYWTNEDISEVITGTSTFITDASIISNSSLTDTHNLTTGGIYTGTTTKYYVIQIDLVSTTPNKFKWSNNGGNTFSNEYVNVSDTEIILENGITIVFSQTSGYSIGDYFTFVVGPTLTVANSVTYATQEAYTLKPDISYLFTETSTDLKLGTSNLERMRITSSGNFGINTQQPLSTFHVSNRNNKKYIVNSITTGTQINPMVAKLTNGGYVIVWEGLSSDKTHYDIYGQIYYPDGQKSGTQFRVNNTTENNQSNPYVTANINSLYGGFMVVWASEDSSNNGIYDIKGQIYNETNEDGSRALKDFDIEINQTTTYNQKFPSVCSLTTGDYIITWESDDSNTGNSNIYAQKITRLGNVSGNEIQVNNTTTYSQNYPIITALSENDNNIPGGFVVAFMSEYDDDGAYDIKYRTFNSSMEAQDSNDVSVTSGTSKTHGRVNIIGLTDGGFALTYFQNYFANSSNYENGETITSTDGTTAVITGINSDYPNKLHVTNISPGGLFHVDALVTGSNSGNVEQVESVSSTSSIFSLAPGDREITFSNNILNLIVNKYSTNSTTPVFINSSVQSTKLVDYNKLYNNDPIAYTREYTIYDYKIPRPSLEQLYNNNLIITWNSGNTPTIYYQKLSILDGSKLGNEININPDAKGIIEYNPSIVSVVTHDKFDNGFVIVWQSETIDHRSEGIYMMKIDDTNYIMRASNGSTEWTITNDSKMGLGIVSPSSQLHIKGSDSDITLQNINTTKGNGMSDSVIKMLDGNSTQLAEIKASYHNYESPHIHGGDLQLWYKFEETYGMITEDHSIRSNTGILRNFELKTNRVEGLINNALRFDGIDSYIDCGDNANITGLCGASFTISIWFKFPSTLESGTYNLINNGVSGNGLYYISINSDNKIQGYFSGTNNITLVSYGTVNDNEWHHVVLSHDSGSQYLTLYLDGNFQNGLSTTSPFISKNDENVFLGATGGVSNFFVGLMDDIKIYNITLSGSKVLQLYKSVNNTIGRLILKTNSGNNLFYDEINSIVIDEGSQFRSLHIKSFPSNPIDGTLDLTSNSIVGTNTLFTQEMMVGDQLELNGNRTTILEITNDTLMAGSEYLSGTDTTIIRYPSIICVKDINDTIKMLMDNEGNCGFGEVNPSSMIHVTGNVPYLTLENTMDENIDGGRESRIIFKGNDSSNSNINYEMARLQVSHNGTGIDNKSKLELSVNNGSELKKTLIIDDDGHVFVGSEYLSTDANMDINSALNVDCNLMISNNVRNNSGINTRNSNIYFKNVEAATGEVLLDNGSYSKITGSSDSNNTGVIGRLDLFTNNESEMVPFISIKGSGYVGLGGINEPKNNIHMSTVYNSVGIASQNGTTVIGSETIFSSVTVGSIFIFSDNSSGVITSVSSSTSLTLDTNQTVSSQSFKIYRPGTSINSSGKMTVNTTELHSSYLHVEGNLSTKVSTVSNSIELDETYSVVLVDTSSNNVSIYLPPADIFSEIKYTIKKISMLNTVNIITSDNLDGETLETLSDNYESIDIVSNGISWFITSRFNSSGGNSNNSNNSNSSSNNSNNISTLNIDTLLDDTYSIILVDTTFNSINITLPNASQNINVRYIIKQISQINQVNIHTVESFDNVSTQIFLFDQRGIDIISNGTTWVILHFYQPEGVF
jgi:hypothetical protein